MTYGRPMVFLAFFMRLRDRVLREGPLSLVARGCRPGVLAEPRVKAKVVLTSGG